jgi:transcriptional regulator with XRE-family HTH domain
MSPDSIERLPLAFADVLVRRRNEQKRTVEALAAATGLSATEIASLERGDYGPTLKDFFRIAIALGEEPAILFIDVVAAWRGDGEDSALYPSRPSSFERLYRLWVPWTSATAAIAGSTPTAACDAPASNRSTCCCSNSSFG